VLAQDLLQTKTRLIEGKYVGDMSDLLMIETPDNKTEHIYYGEVLTLTLEDGTRFNQFFYRYGFIEMTYNPHKTKAIRNVKNSMLTHIELIEKAERQSNAATGLFAAGLGSIVFGIAINQRRGAAPLALLGSGAMLLSYTCLLGSQRTSIDAAKAYRGL